MANASGWMWSSTQPVAVAIKTGRDAYMHRHCRYPAWVRMRTEARQELTAEELAEIVTGLGLLIVDVTTVPPGHYLFGVNGGAQDTVQFGP